MFKVYVLFLALNKRQLKAHKIATPPTIYRTVEVAFPKTAAETTGEIAGETGGGGGVPEPLRGLLGRVPFARPVTAAECTKIARFPAVAAVTFFHSPTKKRDLYGLEMRDFLAIKNR